MARPNPRREAFEVHLDALELGAACRAGTLHCDGTRKTAGLSFAYAPEWLARNPFMLDPRLALYAGDQHPVGDAASFGVFLDSAPDRWGRLLMDRREAQQARREGRPRRTLRELDYLLGVNDQTRQGALRFCRPAGDFLDQSPLPTPPVTALSELGAICDRLEEEGVEELPEYEQWLSLLIAPGSSLGGARPKANFRDADGTLWIAKFPAKQDLHDVGGWEHVVHRLADAAKISVSSSRMVRLGSKHHTFCVQRFDRVGGSRRMYASAMTLLEKQDGQPASYLEMAEFISVHGGAGHIASDLAQLFRRVVFNVLVSNRDDHLRNHGFIRVADGWRLSDAFDMNPTLAKTTHALALDEASDEPDIEAVVKTAAFYRLEEGQALDILEEVAAVVATWAKVAAGCGLSKAEIGRMERAFLA